MKHLCKNCIYCEKLGKSKGKYITYCKKELSNNPIEGRIKNCEYHEKKYITFDEFLSMHEIVFTTITKK